MSYQTSWNGFQKHHLVFGNALWVGNVRRDILCHFAWDPAISSVIAKKRWQASGKWVFFLPQPINSLSPKLNATAILSIYTHFLKSKRASSLCLKKNWIIELLKNRRIKKRISLLYKREKLRHCCFKALSVHNGIVYIRSGFAMIRFLQALSKRSFKSQHWFLLIHPKLQSPYCEGHLWPLKPTFIWCSLWPESKEPWNYFYEPKGALVPPPLRQQPLPPWFFIEIYWKLEKEYVLRCASDMMCGGRSHTLY